MNELPLIPESELEAMSLEALDRLAQSYLAHQKSDRLSVRVVGELMSPRIKEVVWKRIRDGKGK